MFQPWTRDFSVDEGASLEVPAWVELPGIPVALWPFMERIMAPLVTFICAKQPKFYGFLPYKRVYVKIDLSKDLRGHLVDKVDNNSYCQMLVYINLPNNFYRFQSVEHKIKDLPLMESRFKSRNHAIVALVANALHPTR